MTREEINTRTLDISITNKKLKNEIIGCCNLSINDILKKLEKSINHENTDWYDLSFEDPKTN